MHTSAASALILALLLLIASPARSSTPAPRAGETPRPAEAGTTPGIPFPYAADAARSTHGAHLRLIETGRQRTPGTVQVDYRLEGGGFPAGKVYRLWQYALDEPAEALCGALVADASGALVPSDSAAVHESSLCGSFAGIALGAFEYLPGEPYRVAIISSDDSVRAFATAFPQPIESADGPCRLLLEMTSPDRRSFMLWGAGFGRDANLRTRLTAGGETFEGGAFADTAGVVRIQLNAPPGAPGGVATYEVVGRDGHPKITYRWGGSR